MKTTTFPLGLDPTTAIPALDRLIDDVGETHKLSPGWCSRDVMQRGAREYERTHHSNHHAALAQVRLRWIVRDDRSS